MNCPALQSEVGGSEISNYTLAMPGGSAIATFFLCRVGLILQNIGGSNLTTFFVCRPIFLQIVSVLLALAQYICRIKDMQTIPLQTKAARLSFSPYLKFFELDLPSLCKTAKLVLGEFLIWEINFTAAKGSKVANYKFAGGSLVKRGTILWIQSVCLAYENLI